MQLLRYYLCLFYTNYAYTKKQWYFVSCSSVYIFPPQRRGTIWSIGWEVRSGQHFRRSTEFMSLNFQMLLLCYHYICFHYLLCGFYKDYGSPKQWYYMVLWFSVSFILPQRRRWILEIGWEVRFGQHFRRQREFMSLNISYASLMLSLHYRSCSFYKDYALTKKSPKKLCYVNTMLLCLFMLWCCYVSQYLLCLYEEKWSSYCYTFTQTYIFKGVVTLLNSRNNINMIF